MTTDDAARGQSTKAPRTRILVSVPTPEDAAFFPEQTWARLMELGDVRAIQPAELVSSEQFAIALNDVDVLVTGWGFPRLDGHRLSLAPRLRQVVHSASSLKALVSEEFWRREVPISQAGAAMAPAVAEMSLTLTLALLRRVHRLDHALRSGIAWDEARRSPRARELSASRVGVIGASRTGRRYISACQALGAEVFVYDPYLTQDDPLHGLAVDLPTLLTGSDVLALHAPSTPETTGMLGSHELALLPDGAALVNTARSSLLDMDALYEAVSSGRLDAALDVHDVEPLPQHDRWRALPNALLTPHLAGATADSRRRAGLIVVDEIDRLRRGLPLQHAVTREQMERMA